MEAGNYKDALSLLEKSLKMNMEVLGGDHMSNAQIFTVVSNVYTKQRDYEKALMQMKKVEQIYMQHSADPLVRQEHLGNTYLEMARILNKNKDNDSLEAAIQCQSKAVEAFISLDKYSDTDYLASIVMTLSEF
jgi:tetratricopeptide (TPR) repeat protein